MNEENDNNAWNAHAGLYGESHKTGERNTRSLWPGLSAEVSSVKLHSKVSHGDTRQWHLEQSASSLRPRPESSYAAYSRGKPSFHENSERWQEHEALVADRIDGMQRSRHLLHQQQQQQQQQLQQQQQHRKDFEERRRRSSRPALTHTPSLLLQKRDEPWTRLENDEFSSRPYTNGGRTQSTRERAQALVERTTSEDLLAMLNEQRLDNLETKTRLTQEIKAKRDELKRREMELIDHEQALRRQHDLLQKEREENQERQRQLEGERKNLQTKTKYLTREMEAMRKTVSRGEKEKFRAEDKLRQQILEKNQKIGLLERDMDLVRGRLEIAEAKVKTASHTEAALRQTNSSIVVELKTAQHEQSQLHKQLERAREREAELEASLSKTREERDRAEDRAARATRAADDASRQLATEKLRAAAFEDDLRKMQEHTLMSARSGESRKLRLEDQSARRDGEDVTLASATAIANVRGPGRQEYLEMLAEVKRCLEEVQASKQANQVLEQRARRAEAELAALKSGSGDEGEKDFRKEMDGSSSLSLKESNALTKEATRLRSELEQREKTLTQAEWDRVAAEQEAEQVRSALQEAQSELEATLRQLKDVQQRAMESDEQLEVARDLEADLQQKLEEATFKLDEMEAQQEASREKAASYRADEERLLRDVIGEVTQYLGAAKRLTALLDAFLEGEQPTMDVLLDDVDGDTDAGARFAALSSSERVVVLRELQTELAASRDSVLQVRSRIADNYAENLGSDCNVQ